jgi:hypothetical protein
MWAVTGHSPLQKTDPSIIAPDCISFVSPKQRAGPGSPGFPPGPGSELYSNLTPLRLTRCKRPVV